MEDTWFCRSVRERERSMFRLAWAMLRNEADCEDAVQSAILKAYEALSTLRDKNAFGSWLLRILQRECLQLLKKTAPDAPAGGSAGTFLGGCSCQRRSARRP